MLKLSYYCRGGGDKDISKLLKEIEEKHGIRYEILDLSRQEQEKQVYERDFRPRAKILKKRTGESVTQLRGAGGKRRYYVSTPGTIAIIRNGQVEWYTIDEIKGFLNGVLLQGQAFLEKLCA